MLETVIRAEDVGLQHEGHCQKLALYEIASFLPIDFAWASMVRAAFPSASSVRDGRNANAPASECQRGAVGSTASLGVV
jgi:hypothetical protein